MKSLQTMAATRDEEYDALEATLVDGATTVASDQCNTARTRSPKLPHDSGLMSLSGGRFINATRVAFDDAPELAYIATQAPLDPAFYGSTDTRADFWELVLEQAVSTVVCLSRVCAGRNGCPRYWPQSAAEYFPLQALGESICVRLVKEELQDGIVVRVIELQRRRGSCALQVHTMQHIHFTEWPDYGVPTSATPILSLVNRVQQAQRTANGAPLMVHCSAGHGRTGCFISIYSRLVAPKSDSSSLMATVQRLRSCRNCWMVQGASQYAFCRDAIDAGVSRRVCMGTLVTHLDKYLLARPKATYEEWVANCHPENCSNESSAAQGCLEIDERFYHETSDHRLLWNQKVDSSRKRLVPCTLLKLQ